MRQILPSLLLLLPTLVMGHMSRCAFHVEIQNQNASVAISAGEYINDADKFQERVAGLTRVPHENGKAYRVAPTLRMDPTALKHSRGTHPLVKFDDHRENGNVIELIDAKFLKRAGNPVTTPKALNQTIRALEAAEQNSVDGKLYKVVYVFSDQKAAEKYLSHARKNPFLRSKIDNRTFIAEWPAS